jgi:hypothetical protein
MVIDRMDRDASDESDLERLTLVLHREQEPNWQAFILGLLGEIHFRLGDLNDARENLTKSVTGFEHHMSSFDDVSFVFCQAAYRLGFISWESEEWELASSYLLRCLPHMQDVYINAPVFIGNIYSLLSSCFNHMGRLTEALAFSEAQAFVEERGCDSLESLVMDYTNLELIQKARSAYATLQDRCADWDHMDRARDFADRHKLGARPKGSRARPQD